MSRHGSALVAGPGESFRRALAWRSSCRLAERAVRDVLKTFSNEASVDVRHPEAPLAPFATVRTPSGEVVAVLSAHADAANVLVGDAGVLCSFDDGSPETRARRLAGAVAVLVACSSRSAASRPA